MKPIVKCTNCAAQADFVTLELAPGLSGRRCPSCRGTLLEMTEYRRWSALLAPPVNAAAAPAPQEQAGSRNCPRCSRVLLRYRVSADTAFHIDRCPNCQLVWFDAGEWESMVAAGLAARLIEVMSDTWQREVHAKERSRHHEAALRDRHGDACIDEILRIRTWLATQPLHEELLVLIAKGW